MLTFYLHDLVVLFFLSACPVTLPRKLPAAEVHQAIADSLEDIPAALLEADMGIDLCVSRRTRPIEHVVVDEVLVHEQA